MKIALIANFDTQLLERQLKLPDELVVPAGSGSWLQACTDTPHEIAKADVAFALLDGRGLLETGFDLAASALKSLMANAPALQIFVSLVDVRAAEMRPLDGADRCRDFEGEWNGFVRGLSASNLLVNEFDIKSLVEELGRRNFYDDRMRYAADMPFSLKGLCAIADEIAHCVDIMRNSRKKVLAVDFDGVLWGGVIGEDGVEGIRLPPAREGLPYGDFQRSVKALGKIGVIVVGVSKNNEEDVAPIWSDGRMALGRDDFAIVKCNWKSKSENLRDIADELNLSLDSFVFVDDRDDNRLEVKGALPEVEVPDFPKDVSQLEEYIGGIARKYFLPLRLTGESVNRMAQYKAEGERRNIRAMDKDALLKALGQKVTVRLASSNADILRVSELSSRANQFKSTSWRPSLGELVSMKSDPNVLVFVAECSDKFGDCGIVSYALVELKGDVAEIVDFALSCKVSDRNVEETLFSRVKAELKKRGIANVGFRFEPTKRNAPLGAKVAKLSAILKDAE